MPIYSFKCPQCKAIYEPLKRVGDYKQICPYCEEPTQMKLTKDTYKVAQNPYNDIHWFRGD